MRLIEGLTTQRTYPCIVFYEDRLSEWRWSLYARNGKLVAEGGESYTKKSGVVRAIGRFVKTCVLVATGKLAPS